MFKPFGMYKAGKNPFQWLQKVPVVPFVQDDLASEHETELTHRGRLNESAQVRRLNFHPFDHRLG
jgi:hypothetical protein